MVEKDMRVKHRPIRLKDLYKHRHLLPDLRKSEEVFSSRLSCKFPQYTEIRGSVLLSAFLKISIVYGKERKCSPLGFLVNFHGIASFQLNFVVK
ncbi:hypothetical protein AVEN_107827-1 [Araneus ventricosus]|uniref:Uncharacterized protein n=1 Tax=Araneus ventricosus TaxID=182803 RepID=A0A4Y2JFQ3_ARAVE|nr:hypothetical protein AVEN_107827-1 [Araneus ventricosus]